MKQYDITCLSYCAVRQIVSNNEYIFLIDLIFPAHNIHSQKLEIRPRKDD